MAANSFIKIIKGVLRRKDLLAALLIIIAGILLAVYLFREQQKKIDALDKEIAQEEQRVSISKELTLITNKIAKVSEPYIKKATSLTIEKFNDFAYQTKVRILSIIPEPESDEGIYTLTAFKLKLQTGYHELGKFLAILESQPDIVRMQELSIQRLETESKDKLKATLKVTLIFIKQE